MSTCDNDATQLHTAIPDLSCYLNYAHIRCSLNEVHKNYCPPNRGLALTSREWSVRSQGAKNIGTVFRDKDEQLVMIDDPKLDPIFAHLKEKEIVLVGHLGEPETVGCRSKR